VCLPLLIFPCTVKSRGSLLAPAHLSGPGKRAVKRLWCGVVHLLMFLQFGVMWHHDFSLMITEDMIIIATLN